MELTAKEKRALQSFSRFNGSNLILNSDMALISAWVKTLLCIVGLKQGLIRYKNVPLWWIGACTRALENQQDIRPTFTHGGGGIAVTDR